MLIFNLKREWFEKIKSGEKTHEYREVKDYWMSRIIKALYGKNKINSDIKETLSCLRMGLKIEKEVDICFMNGMLSEEDKPRLYAKMKHLSIKNGLKTDLKIDKPVFDIEFELVR